MIIIKIRNLRGLSTFVPPWPGRDLDKGTNSNYRGRQETSTLIFFFFFIFFTAFWWENIKVSADTEGTKLHLNLKL